MNLGQLISSARNSAKLTVDSLSTATSIRPSLIKEFEANNFINAGGDAYARGHLKNIARALNVDPEVLLHQYDEEHAQAKRAIHEQLVENSATIALPERKKLTNKQLAIYSGIGIFLLLLTSVVVNSLKQSASAPKPKPSATASATPTKSAEPSAQPTVDATANTYSSGSGVMVKLEAATGSSWLFVSDAAGTTLYSGRASQGQVFEFSSTETVNLRIGNAGAVKLTVNGKEVSPLGADGEVVNVSYGVNS
jgi:cytoskeletal protein RodZ